MNLSTEMELPTNRETILHDFERVQRPIHGAISTAATGGDFVLEEDKDKGAYRWCTIEPRRVCSGQVNPDGIEGALEQHRLVLELAPVHAFREPAGLRGFWICCTVSTSPIEAIITRWWRRPSCESGLGTHVGGSWGHGYQSRAVVNHRALTKTAVFSAE